MWTYATLLTATRDGRLGLVLWLGLLLGRLRLGLVFGLLFLLGRLWLGFFLWCLGLRLLLLALGLRRSLLLLGCGFFGLFAGLLFSTSGRSAGLELHNFLSNLDGVLFVDKELLDDTSLGRIHGYVDLVGLNGCDFLILLDVVANLCTRR